MSLQQPLDHSSQSGKSYAELATTPPHEPYDFDLDFYAMENEQQQKTTAADMTAPPPLPQRNALRASRLLDNMDLVGLGLKLGGGPLGSRELGQTTPHDVYLSSEEDGLSSADDFSDYDYESGSEEGQSPRRRSHEVTARVVSVIFAGKPSLIDLSLSRRSASPSSRPQSCAGTISSVHSSPSRRTSTSAHSLSSLNHPPRKSSIAMAALAGKPRPPFLNIDPFANGSTYSLELPKESSDEPPKTPKTPTTLLKGVSRTFSLVKKRSRPMLNSNQTAAAQSQDNLASASPSTTTTTNKPDESLTPVAAPEPPVTPQSPVTYNDILRAAKKNARAAAAPSPVLESPVSPVSPSAANGKKGFLGGLAARRRSMKIVNGRIL